MPLSPESWLPGTSLSPFPGVHRYTVPLTLPARIVWNAVLSEVSRNLVTTNPPPDSAATELPLVLGGSATQPIHSAEPFEAVSLNTSTDSWPP